MNQNHTHGMVCGRGLKILVSAVQFRPWAHLFSHPENRAVTEQSRLVLNRAHREFTENPVSKRATPGFLCIVGTSRALCKGGFYLDRPIFVFANARIKPLRVDNLAAQKPRTVAINRLVAYATAPADHPDHQNTHQCAHFSYLQQNTIPAWGLP